MALFAIINRAFCEHRVRVRGWDSYSSCLLLFLFFFGLLSVIEI